MTLIINTLANYPVGWTWAQHKAAGYQGGTDYIVPAGTHIGSPVAGTASYAGRMADGNYMMDITYAVGRKITLRELNTVAFAGSRVVKIGDVIGTADAIKWVHIDATILGIRRQFEPLVTKTTSIASTGTVKPVVPPTSQPPVRNKDMTFSIAKASTTAPSTYGTISTGHDYLVDVATGKVGWLELPGESDLIMAQGVVRKVYSGAEISAWVNKYGVLPNRRIA